ncbi:hypothetical protein D2E24_1914 [Bifidobacterium samirii]|uniref:Uncharacterized protein n=1 Tax=Bifidobacterium samirii TaxID=2306974 RepID=A0A430FDU7_9BIFI|nr:hypothetical protein D2E24_1914 [Bifidobacterium samirii]
MSRSGETSCRSAVHPRLRGEDPAPLPSEERKSGSPPLARGRSRGESELGFTDRFTPACAGKMRLLSWHQLTSPVHPRLRGEDWSKAGCSKWRSGSPPLARGRSGHLRQFADDVRFTPACAGKMPSALSGPFLRPVHPRLRGEDVAGSVESERPSGSPPLARGRCLRLCLFIGPGRFTPACAGKISASSGTAVGAAVHPRLRGEDWPRPPAPCRRTGSPPLARGRSDRRSRRGFPRRFTPACAGKIMSRLCLGSPLPVHPRLRGEDGGCRPAHWAMSGSPPLARGRSCRACAWVPRSRFTPACAGKMSGRARPRRAWSVHPRLRGEDLTAVPQYPGYYGSPPLARGRYHQHRTPGRTRRFTPACAGKMRPSGCCPSSPTVHPRLRGEDGHLFNRRQLKGGSPPLARGRSRASRPKGSSGRFTPACAGKISRIILFAISLAVHPRLRGEDFYTLYFQNRITGSPPLARGRFIIHIRPRAERRFTPACAGKMPTCARLMSVFSVHPRLRGEDADMRPANVCVFGSPPLARGRFRRGPSQRFALRFTPACAGKIDGRTSRARSMSVHPRLRGEDCRQGLAPKGWAGSPPLARGRSKKRPQRIIPTRFTPACAGKIRTLISLIYSLPVHPRLRGEDVSNTLQILNVRGSPPLARGRSVTTKSFRLRTRFTPACAGKICFFKRTHNGFAVHPRLRGEDKSLKIYNTGYAGSPPLARGRL